MRSRPARYRLTAQSRERPDCLAQHDKWHESYEEDLDLPWQRVLGAGGHIKLTGDSAIEQRLRLEAEGVRFRGRSVDLKAHEWKAQLSKARSKSPTTTTRRSR